MVNCTPHADVPQCSILQHWLWCKTVHHLKPVHKWLWTIYFSGHLYKKKAMSFIVFVKLTTAGSWWKNQKSSSFSIHEAECLSVPVWCQSPGAFLNSCWFQSMGILKKLGLTPASRTDLMNLLARVKNKQAKSKSSFLHTVFCGLPPLVWTLI